MSANTSQILDEAFQARDGRRKTEVESRAKKVQEQNEKWQKRTKKFEDLVETVILPTCKKFGELLKKKGAGYEITRGHVGISREEFRSDQAVHFFFYDKKENESDYGPHSKTGRRLSFEPKYSRLETEHDVVIVDSNKIDFAKCDATFVEKFLLNHALAFIR